MENIHPEKVSLKIDLFGHKNTNQKVIINKNQIY